MRVKHKTNPLRSPESGVSGKTYRIRDKMRGSNKGMPRVNETEMRKKLASLKVEHRDLDAAIDALRESGSTDQLQIARLKKRKLALKDQIGMIEDYLIPDIIA